MLLSSDTVRNSSAEPTFMVSSLGRLQGWLRRLYPELNHEVISKHTRWRMEMTRLMGIATVGLSREEKRMKRKP